MVGTTQFLALRSKAEKMATANSVHDLVPNLNELIFGCLTDDGIAQLDLAVAILKGLPVRYDPMGFGSRGAEWWLLDMARHRTHETDWA